MISSMASGPAFESGRAYPIGSRCRSLFRFSTLSFSAFAILTILYMVIEHYIGNGFLALFLLLGGLITALFREVVLQRISRWVAFAMKDSADGVIDGCGLRYRSFLKWHSIPWAKI